jgi:SlyX protein
MSDDELTSRIEALEIRLMDQDASIEEMTRTLLNQGQLLRLQQETIERLEQLLQSLSAGSINRPGEEPPPPHY